MSGSGGTPDVEPAALDDLLERWVAATLLTATQAEAILAAEARWGEAEPAEEPEPAAPRRERPRRHVPLIAEALRYVGAVLAAAAAGVAVNEFWADLETWAKLLVLGYTTVLMAGAAQSLRHAGEPAFQRLRSVLLLIATVGVGVWARLLLEERVHLADQNVLLLGSVATALAAAVAFRLRPVAIQQLALAVALAGVATGVVAQYDHADADLYGAGVWALGVDWALLGYGRYFEPRATAYSTGLIGALVGAQMVTVELPALGLWLGVGTAALAIAGSLVARSHALLGLGSVGLFLFVTELVAHYVGRRAPGTRGTGLEMALVLFVAGIALLGIALLIARLRERARPEEVSGG